MPLVLRQPYQIQPAGYIAVNQQNSIATGLAILCNLVGRNPAQGAINLVDGFVATVTGTQTQKTGSGFYSNYGASGRNYSAAATNRDDFGTGYNSSGNRTFVVLAYDAGPGASTVWTFGTGANTIAAGDMGIRPSGTNIRAVAFASGAQVTATGSARSTYGNKFALHGCTHDQTNLLLYENGRQTATIACGAASVSSNTTHISNSSTDGNTTSYVIAMVAYWKRLLAPSEMYLLAQNPWQLFAPIQRRIWVSTPSGPITLALTGVTGTGSVGTLGINVNTALTGLIATGSVGTVAVSVDKALVGVSATGSVGTLGVAVDKALTGVSSTGSVGSVTPNVSITLNGVSATGSVGNLGVNVDTALTGLTATGSVGTVTPVTGIFVALTGVSAAGSVGSLGVNVDTALTGVSATGSVGTISVSGTITPQTAAETPAGRSRRFRDIYRVTIDGQRFEFRTLDAALQFLEKAKATAAKLAAEASRAATERQRSEPKRLPPPKFKAPSIEISSRELRKAAAETKRDIEIIYQAAARDAEISMLMELNKRAEDDDEALFLLM